MQFELQKYMFRQFVNKIVFLHIRKYQEIYNGEMDWTEISYLFLGPLL